MAGFQIEVDEDMMTNGQLAKNNEMDRAQLEIDLEAETLLDDSSTAPSEMAIENIVLEQPDASALENVQRIGGDGP